MPAYFEASRTGHVDAAVMIAAITEADAGQASLRHCGAARVAAGSPPDSST